MTNVLTVRYLTIFLVILLFSCKSKNGAKEVKEQGIKNEPVEEKTFVDLNGSSQYVEIKGASKSNPVLLFIHGGPGWPQTPQLRYFNDTITRSVTLVAWEQMGAGKSFMKNPQPQNLSLNQIIADGHELTRILKKKFNQQKIYLAGFSWGSVVGLSLVERYPNDYIAYFGISQVVNLQEAMKISREWIRKQAAKDNATLKLVDRLEKQDTSLCKSPLQCFIKQYELVNKYHGAVYDPVSEENVTKAMTYYADYRDYEWEKAFEFSASKLESDMFNADMSKIKKIEVPAYFLLGRHDWNVPSVLGASFAGQLQAPHKEIIWFENSGHGPLEEEPSLFNKVIIERCRK